MHVEVEHMLATGRIDVLAETSRYIYVMELKLSCNGGLESAASQIRANRYTAPFEVDAHQTIALAIELDDQGKGLVGWKVVE